MPHPLAHVCDDKLTAVCLLRREPVHGTIVRRGSCGVPRVRRRHSGTRAAAAGRNPHSVRCPLTADMNLESYNAIAEQWEHHRVQLSPLEAQVLPILTEGLPPNSTLLDLGCGTGQPVAAFFAAAGFHIVGVDQSPAMLALAKRRLPAHQWLLGTLEDFPPTSHVGAVIAWDSLFHVPRDRHAGIFRRVRDTLPVGGRFALTVGGSEHPAFTDVMFGHEFFYDSFPPAQTAALLVTAGFRIVHETYLNHADGARDRGRVALIVAAA